MNGERVARAVSVERSIRRMHSAGSASRTASAATIYPHARPLGQSPWMSRRIGPSMSFEVTVPAMSSEVTVPVMSCAVAVPA
jgi:SOS-response transcriptional repressor LexA